MVTGFISKLLQSYVSRDILFTDIIIHLKEKTTQTWFNSANIKVFKANSVKPSLSVVNILKKSY